MSDVVSIIILACNQIEYSKLCLASIRSYTTVPYQLILVDNGSRDETLSFFHSIPEAQVIHNSANQGFAKGNNQGLKHAKGEYILFLNNDTIVTPGWLEQLYNCLTAQADYGCVGPRTNFAAVTGMPELSFNTLSEIDQFARYFNHPDPSKWFSVDWLPGFCLLTRRSLLEEIGGFDEKFKLGLCEDVDLGRSITRLGWKNVCAGDTFVYHFGSRTFLGQHLNMDKLYSINSSYLAKKWEQTKR